MVAPRSHSTSAFDSIDRVDVHAASNRNVCVCIVCHTHCQNKTALRKHGEKEDHRPYGCVCGENFARSDVLERHIASKNKVAKFYCPFCEHGQAPKAFSRADHLPQHLRAFHKIPAGIIPEGFAPNFAHNRPAENSASPQSAPSFPCLIPGCTRIGERAYIRQIDLEEHIESRHPARQDHLHIQQEPNNHIPTWTNNIFQQNAYLQPAQMSRQNTQQNHFLQLDPAGNFQVGGGYQGNNMCIGNTNSQPNGEFDNGFGNEFNIDIDTHFSFYN
ncbi:hypothetical protein HD806DRAFT_504151 [Xylariaceae sp. AK1471]|nr:hypothetical protein HD806DRAFT_504151 [Xylariaceae sp. AK1471]